MGAIHPAKLESGRAIFVHDPIPLGSAVLFKYISDEILSSNPAAEVGEEVQVPTVIEPNTALSAVNNTLEAIDSSLILVGKSRKSNLSIKGRDESERIVIKCSDLINPQAVRLATRQKDQSARQVKIERTSGSNIMARASFTDGHQDYARSLALGFAFRSSPNHKKLIVCYTMHRQQARQDMTVVLSRFLEYEGFESTTSLYTHALSEGQEMALLNVFADIGDIATNEVLEAKPA